MSAGAAEEPKVLIKDFLFTPLSLTVKAGTAVTWVNMDDEPHNVISDTGLFRSGGFDTNESFSHKFDKPGTYRVKLTVTDCFPTNAAPVSAFFVAPPWIVKPFFALWSVTENV